MAVWGAKVFDVVVVVLQRVLTWKREATWMYVRDPEDLPVVMEPLKRSVKCVEGVLREHVLTCDVAKV